MGRDRKTTGSAGRPSGDTEPGTDRRSATGRKSATHRGPGERGVDKKFKWALGHEPDYKEPDSGWVYIQWDYTEAPESDPNQAKGLGGGPEAFPCDRCQTIMRIVARKKPSEIIKGSDVIRLTADADLSAVDTDEIFLVCCPKCDQRVQMPGRHVRHLRHVKLGRV